MTAISYNPSEKAGMLFKKYPCLYMIWAFSGSGLLEKRTSYVIDLLSSADISTEDISCLIESGTPYLAPRKEIPERTITGRKAYDVLTTAYIALGYPRGKKVPELQYDPCVFCSVNCSGKAKHQQKNIFDDELIIFKFLLLNSPVLLPSLKELFPLASQKKFLKMFNSRDFFYLRENSTSGSDIISFPVLHFTLSAFLGILKKNHKKTDMLHPKTNLGLVSPASVLVDLLEEGGFIPFLDGKTKAPSRLPEYDSLIRRSFLKILHDSLGSPITYGDFMASVGALSAEYGSGPFFDSLDPAGSYTEIFDDDCRTIIVNMLASENCEEVSEQDRQPVNVSVVPSTAPVEVPEYDLIRKQTRAQIDTLVPKNLDATVSPVPDSKDPEDTMDQDNNNADITETSQQKERPQKDPPPTSSMGRTSATTTEQTAANPCPLFSPDGILLLDNAPAGSFTEYAPHLSDEYFCRKENCTSFSMELARFKGKTGYLLYGYPDNNTADKDLLPFFISLEDAEQITENSGLSSLLFDFGNKIYYSYNKPRIVSHMLRICPFQPDTLIKGICSLQVMQCLTFRSNRLWAADLLLPVLEEVCPGARDPVAFVRAYRDIYLKCRDRLLSARKGNMKYIRFAEAFEYALGTSMDISAYATVDGENCHRRTWTKSEFEYSDFRKLRKRGIHVGFEFIPKGPKQLKESELYYTTALCIGRCLSSQVISKSKPVLLGYESRRVDFLLPSFGDPEKPWVQSRLHNAFTAFNVCFKDMLTALGLKDNTILRNLYPFEDQLPVEAG